MKYKWDNKNVIDYAVYTAKAEGIEQSCYTKSLSVARELKDERFDIAFIVKITKLSIAEIEKL